MTAAATGFGRLYWGPPPGTTFGQLAVLIAPYATEKILVGYRDPNWADRPAALDPDEILFDITMQVMSITGDTAAVFGRGVLGGSTQGRHVVPRTFNLVRGSDGVWRVDGFGT